ncbi:unnamed protein product [Candidula unifasciata]|uniref:Uncharacterized protein n=1 Tax=Candidula unifasciata TaxID=100452 RepID=A0A8S3ZKS5_9EUPU|nr:unnamed protein product [Candidula unifasciata]
MNTLISTLDYRLHVTVKLPYITCGCQDMTSFMFQALGMDPPPMLPVMPQSLREHLYPGAREQQQLMLQKRLQLQQQKQRYLNYLMTQRQRQTMQTMKVMRDQPRKITDAKAAGCKLPVDSAAASVLMFGDCKNPAARMVCQAELMTCMNVGMAAMCCPYGMNRLAMDTISYVDKMQQFMAELA